MERRSSSRKNLYLSVALQVPAYNKRIVPATLLDISLAGAFIGTQVLLPSNAALIVELKLPGKFVQKSFRLKAKLVRRTSRGVGVAFAGMPAGVINGLARALAQYEKQFESRKPGFVINKLVTS